MKIDIKQIISLEDTVKDFAKAAKIADGYGQAVIFDDDSPKYVVGAIDKISLVELTDDEIIGVCAQRIFERYLPAFEELAK